MSLPMEPNESQSQPEASTPDIEGSTVVEANPKAAGSSREQPFKSVLVDLDFALLPGVQAAYDAAAETFAALELAFDEIRFARVFGTKSLNRGCNALATLEKARIDAAQSAQAIAAGLAERLQNSAADARTSTLEALNALNANDLAICFLTRLPEDTARALLSQIGFDASAASLVVAQSDRLVGYGADIWKRAVQTLNWNPNRCAALVAGGVSTKGALAASMRVVALREPLTDGQDFSGADYIFDPPYDAQTLGEALRAVLHLEAPAA